MGSENNEQKQFLPVHSVKMVISIFFFNILIKTHLLCFMYTSKFEVYIKHRNHFLINLFAIIVYPNSLKDYLLHRAFSYKPS